MTDTLVVARFNARVDRRGDCWLWLGSTTRGYGTLRVDGGPVYAHRIAYEIAHGSIDASLDILHSCDNPRCVNPAHLSLGTRADNLADAARKGRMNKKLSPGQTREILRRRASGEQLKVLARHYGVNVSSIKRIVYGRVTNGVPR